MTKQLVMNLPRGNHEEFTIHSGEMDHFLKVLHEVAQWCLDTGLNNWNLAELTREKMLAGLTEEQFYVGKVAGDPAACMVLQWHDDLFWPEIPPGQSGFIHKLAVRRKYAGQGLSQELVTYAITECRKRKIGYLRLDTRASREKLCRLYESMGFVRVGQRMVRGNEYALFEMKL